MEINLNELNFTIKLATDGKPHPNILAFVTLIFKGEFGEYITISSFTLWKSQFGGYNLEPPGKPGFKYSLIGKSLKEKIKREIIDQYERMKIPVIEEK